MCPCCLGRGATRPIVGHENILDKTESIRPLCIPGYIAMEEVNDFFSAHRPITCSSSYAAHKAVC